MTDSRLKSPVRNLNGKDVSRETMERLESFEETFVQWSRRINLVANSTKGDFWERHIADSAQIYQLGAKPGVWIDMGSGAGFPGLVTAIFLAEQGTGWVHLIESNNKKASFLRAAILATGARASVHCERIEIMPSKIDHADYVSARALADLSKLLEFIHPWSLRNPELKAFLHKGRDYQSELANSHRRWQFDLVEHPSSIEPDSVILEICGLQAKTTLPG
ncbi:16S rRNA (guanine(527)-N(7))-methyltransferase RsmG [Rhizobium alvei]|uniref:Ribosomal RNA small subunit methyltransferase G n=1 Tax=Rhizobium alvei TaxID=1132659 RepID=A0ABT8YLX8_9HYPH|nr:16S rRNA (guanine(527)-N(7))-methyltransferase RsmG [Rhizobium alvei]MDO6964730.1 16S rRNA (guanine(527)-N(7))-methyltransferase RsmG [Rhizobium alvei]